MAERFPHALRVGYPERYPRPLLIGARTKHPPAVPDQCRRALERGLVEAGAWSTSA